MASINNFDASIYSDFSTIIATIVEPFESYNPLMVHMVKCTPCFGDAVYMVERGYPNPLKDNNPGCYEENGGALYDCTDKLGFEDKQEALAFAMRLVVKEVM